MDSNVSAARSPIRLALIALGGLAIAAALGFIALLSLASARPENIDDAFILFVYMRHLLEHGAFFWNSSQGAVDGFTSLLDLLLKTGAAEMLGGIIRGAFWTTLVCHLFVPLAGAGLGIWLLFKSGERRLERLLGALLCGLALATSPALAQGSSFMLETPLYCLLLIVCVALAFAAPEAGPALAIASFALLLARPEGLPLGICLVGYFALAATRLPARARWLPAALFAGLSCACFVWRIWLFGYWAPNTYYAKSSERRWLEILDGLAYVTNYLRSLDGALVGLLLIIGVALLGVQPWKLEWRRRAGLIWLLALGSVASVIYGGGDCYPGARFLAAPIVLIVLGLLVSCFGLERWLRAVPIAALLVLAIVQSRELIGKKAAIVEQLRNWPLDEHSFDCDRRFAEALSAELPDDATLAESDFQRFKYYDDSRTILDLSGLNDRQIAHRAEYGPVRFGKFSHDDAVAKDAAVWIWGYRVRTEDAMSRNPLRDILQRPDLIDAFVGYNPFEMPSPATAARMLERYQPASLDACNTYFNFLVHKDLAGSLANRAISLGEPSPIRSYREQNSRPPGAPHLLADAANAPMDTSKQSAVALRFGDWETRPLLRDGFSSDEHLGAESWVWSDAKSSRLVLPMAPLRRAYRLVLEASSIGADDGSSLPVSVVVNHQPSGTLSIAKSRGRYSLTLPADRLVAGDNELEFDYPRTARPSGADTRDLAVQFESLRLEPLWSRPNR